ncbi:MAG: hypothetical protein J0I48_08790 [Devosia sp.]|uniref:hypothetical protein n=1 Tax=Devosia sp. 66-22 TaxID=1895753 RepID=UPI00092653E5|nr:hypothetical protein [Devosia sp. 66-22]MBN9346284.1 hypothetical protein [Devosia sp.]OJX55083.1 MAG: hypothetical protein BGO81_01145 [Devosia sp. 66-22]
MVKKPDKPEKPKELSQLDKFKETAKQAETDDSEAGFDRALRRVTNLSRSVLRHGGRVKMEDAKAKAEREYDRFAASRKLARHEAADALIRQLRAEEKTLPKQPRKRP